MGRDISKGDVPVLVLAVLAETSCHGYAIAREIERRSGQKFTMREGTLYPALRVLEQNGWIKGNWEVQPSGPARKVYTLTQEGEAELTRRSQEWQDYTKAFTSILGNRGGENAQPA